MTGQDFAALDAVLASGVDAGTVPGVVAIVVDRDGVCWQGAFGERSLGGGVPMTLDTVGAIYSMTKAITGAAVMQAVEAGLLDLDAAAGDVLDDLADPQVLTGFDADGHPQVRPAATRVTLRNLLTHTSGYAYDLWNADIARWIETVGAPNRRAATKEGLRTPLAFDPGARWEYGTGIDWAGLVLEAATGQLLGDYFAERLFAPLGMTDTAYVPTASMLERLADLHLRGATGELSPVAHRPVPENREYDGGGGGLFSTMPDYARFLRMILNEGSLDGVRVLQPETIEAMARNHMGDLRVAMLPTTDPVLSNDAELFPGEEKSWGLTFQIHEEPGFTGRPAGTLTWAGLGNSYFWIDPANGIAGAYLTQLFPFADHGSLGLFYDFERAVYDAIG